MLPLHLHLPPSRSVTHTPRECMRAKLSGPWRTLMEPRQPRYDREHGSHKFTRGRIRSVSCLLSNQGGADDVTYGVCNPTSAPTMTLAPTLAPTTMPDMGSVSTFSALSAYCQIDNADITVTGDIAFTDQIPITGRKVSITSTTDVAFTSDRSFSASSGGMLLIEGGAEVTLSGLHFVSGSASSYGGCLCVVHSDLAIFNSSFTSCSSEVGGAYIGVGQDAHAHTAPQPRLDRQYQQSAERKQQHPTYTVTQP